jgi:putative ABC transport system substrate-binding protein
MAHCAAGLRAFACSMVAIALVIATAAVEISAQPAPKVARVAVVLFETPPANPNVAAFTAGLRDLGYVEGKNLALEYHYAEGRPERIRELGPQAVALKPDVIVTLGGDMVATVKDATSTIPVVMLTSQDPVESGVVASFARPGGNLTGVAFVSEETVAKRLQFLKEAVPSVKRVGVLWNPNHFDGEYRVAAAAARQLGIEALSLEARSLAELDAALEAAIRGRAEALMVVSSRFMNGHRAPILDFAAKHRLPVVSGWGPWARAGSLISYGPDLNVLARRTAFYVDRILKGARPAELPVEQPNKFELVINAKTAKTLGLVVPASLLGRADHIVE